IALRVALGVARKRLFAQLLTESLLLATLGGVAGVVFAQSARRILESVFLRRDATLAVATDWRTLGFCAALALTTGLLTGLAPALRSGRENLALALKAGTREGTHQRSRLRATLLVLQGTLAIVLLVVAGIDSVRRLGRFTLQGGSPSFFRTFGTRIVRGRGITSEDTKDAPRVMIVSEAMGRTLWPGRDAIGQCIRVQADTMPCTTVV